MLCKSKKWWNSQFGRQRPVARLGLPKPSDGTSIVMPKLPKSEVDVGDMKTMYQTSVSDMRYKEATMPKSLSRSIKIASVHSRRDSVKSPF